MRAKIPATMLSLALGTVLAISGCAMQPNEAPSTEPTSAPASPTESAAGEESESEAPGNENGGTGDAGDAEEAGVYVDYDESVLSATSGPKALFFHATWCPQCRALDEDLRAQGPPDGLAVFKVDYDSATDLRQRYGVTLQTTVVFIDDDGEEISKSVLYDEPSVGSLRAAMP